MIRGVLIFVAGAFAAWAVDGFLLGFNSGWVCLVLAGILLWATVRRERKGPEQRLEQHLYGLRVVGREEE